MFVPLTVIRAADITIDDIMERLNQRIYFSDSYIRQAGTNIQAEKIGENKIKITATTDYSNAYIAPSDQEFFNGMDMELTTFTIFEYDGSSLSYKGEFGYIGENDNEVNYKNTQKDPIAELIAPQDSTILKEMIYIIYSLKTGEGYNTITDYLYSKGLVSSNGNLLFPDNKPEEITITKTDGWITEYSINSDEINIETNSNQTTNTDCPIRMGGTFTTLKFNTNGGNDIDAINFCHTCADANNEEKIDTPKKEGYKFVGWYTDKDLTKKFNSDKATLELINPLAIQTDECGYEFEATLYAKWEKEISNPKTGIPAYGTAGLLSLITIGGIYILYKNKMSKI